MHIGKVVPAAKQGGQPGRRRLKFGQGNPHGRQHGQGCAERPEILGRGTVDDDALRAVGHEILTRSERLAERERASQLVKQHPVFAYDRKRCDNPSGYIIDTMHAVFQSFFATENFEDCLTDIVNRGGDADTTGAIAGMLAGACYGMEAIPKRWLKALDENINKKCSDQALALMALAGH